MNSTEAMALCRYVKACCPAQKFDEYTPDAWFDLLDDITFEDAKAAARLVAKQQPFVAPAEIRAQVAQTKRAMKRELPPVIPPRELADEPRTEIEWTRVWGDAFIAGHTEERAREIANRQIGIAEDEPLALDAGPATAIKAQMQADARELVLKQSLREAEARDKAEERRARFAAIRAAELETKNDVINSHTDRTDAA